MSKAYELTHDQFGVHQKIIKSVRKESKVLDIGCASGFIAKELIKKDCQVYGIEFDPIASQIAKKYCVQVVIGDIEDPTTLPKLHLKKFDTILLTDVLEHLIDPLSVLKKVKNYLSPSGHVVISIPNVAFLTVRLNLLRGRFDYTKFGIMDETHVKFYTQKSFNDLIAKSGLEIVSRDYVGNFTQLPLYMQTLYPVVGKRKWWRNFEYFLTKLWPEGLAVQFIVSCK